MEQKAKVKAKFRVISSGKPSLKMVLAYKRGQRGALAIEEGVILVEALAIGRDVSWNRQSTTIIEGVTTFGGALI